MATIASAQSITTARMLTFRAVLCGAEALSDAPADVHRHLFRGCAARRAACNALKILCPSCTRRAQSLRQWESDAVLGTPKSAGPPALGAKCPQAKGSARSADLLSSQPACARD